MSINMVKSGKDKLDDIPFYCLYDGNDETYISNLNKLNVNIIKTKISFSNEINNSKILSKGNKNIARGAYLRINIPLHSKNYKYILYVDCDVIFLKNIIIDNFNYINNNYVFACCSEHDWDNINYFNTGVMIMNLEEYKKHYNNFIKFIIDKYF